MADENEDTTVVASTEAANPVVESKSDFDRPALESKVSDRLSALFNDEPEVETEEAAEPTDASTDSNEDTVSGDSAGDDEPAEVVEKTETEKKPEAAVTPATGNTPTLPAAYRRSLHAYGWEDADIDSNLKALGASFIATASKLHSNRNTEVAGWAEAGRAARERAKATDGKQVTPEQAAAGQALKPLDIKALKDHFGDDKMLDALVNPINEAIKTINLIMPQVQQSQANSKQSEMAALGQQIDEFFAGKELQPYVKLYGDTKTGQLEEAHFNARNKVLETADALQHGAFAQGRKLSLKDAMQIAHDSISTGYKVSAVRTEIVNKLKTRQAGITLKPTNKGKLSGMGPVKNQADLEKRTAQRLKAVFAN